jgi:hypothetical protein
MRVSDIELYHYPATRSARVKWLLHKLVGDEFKVNRSISTVWRRMARIIRGSIPIITFP